MNEIKTISKENPEPMPDKSNPMDDSKAIEILIAKNPNLKTFIEKFDLVLINTSKS